MNRTGVMQVVDSLSLGGYERAAVNLANALPRDRYRSYVCATRATGPLVDQLSPGVELLPLGRRRTLDAGAVTRLAAFVRANGIRILHAHGPSLFLARAASLLPPYPDVVWHAHSGRLASEDRAAWPYRIAAVGLAGAIGVNYPLLAWLRRRLRVPSARSWYVPNIVAAGDRRPAEDLPGTRGRRIVCVGNLRPEKDHSTLLRAFAAVLRRVPDAHLLLVGAAGEARYAAGLGAEAAALGLGPHVSFLGQRTDVARVLCACDVGVLSSRFEGLPMALLEYGMAGLPVVATSAGQCGEVLDDGRAGILVRTGDHAGLAEGLAALLGSADLRASMGGHFRRRVEAGYSARAVVGTVCAIYEAACARRPGGISGPRPAHAPAASDR